MMQRYIKPLRLGVSIVMLAAVTFLFLDFSGTTASVWFQRFTWLQLVPSLLQFIQTMMHGLAVTAWGFIAVIVFTLLFGRVYCSYICPLGIFQDVLSWFSAKTRNRFGKRKFRFRFAPSKTWLRYTILTVFLLSLFTGSIYLVYLLDPYSNFGRFASDLFRPVYIVGNNLLVKAFEAVGSYALYPVMVAKTDPMALIFPVAMLALIIWLAVRKGRLYCNTVCPVGTLLGLISKVSLFKIRINVDECNQCGKCMFTCKSQCIDIKKREVDFSRCVGCGNCMKSCDKNAIRYVLSTVRRRQATTPETPVQRNTATDVSKRQFVFGSAVFIAALGSLSVKAIAQPLVKRSQNRRRRRRRISADNEQFSGKGQLEVLATHVVTPPGSQNREHFTGICTACHLCVSACPTGVLQPSLFEYGFFGMMQPFMDYDTNFCNHECVRCTEVCPNGAILPLTREEKLTTQTGIARFEKQNCVVFVDETSCGSCSEHCPTKAVRMVPYKGELTIPEITPEICVGCGACEYACPVTPFKAIVVDGHLQHRTAQRPAEEKLEEKPLEDFPF